jgi:hypothetical protein
MITQFLHDLRVEISSISSSGPPNISPPLSEEYITWVNLALILFDLPAQGLLEPHTGLAVLDLLDGLAQLARELPQHGGNEVPLLPRVRSVYSVRFHGSLFIGMKINEKHVLELCEMVELFFNEDTKFVIDKWGQNRSVPVLQPEEKPCKIEILDKIRQVRTGTAMFVK